MKRREPRPRCRALYRMERCNNIAGHDGPHRLSGSETSDFVWEWEDEHRCPALREDQPVRAEYRNFHWCVGIDGHDGQHWRWDEGTIVTWEDNR